MAPKRYQILHKNGKFRPPVDIEWLDEKMANFAEIAAGRVGDDPCDGRSQQVEWSMFNALIVHLGTGLIDNLPTRLNFGMDCAVAYYLDDWFVPNEENPSKAWAGHETVGHALFLAGMTQRWDDLETIRAWYVANFELQFPREHFTLADCFDLHFPACVLSGLGPEPIPGVADIVAAGMAEKGRNFERVQPMWRAWQAVVADDQKLFNKEFPAAVRAFLKGDGFDDVSNPEYSVAVDASYIWLLAERRGMTFPKLTDKQDAAVARRETVGLVAGVDPRPKSPDGTVEPDIPPKRHEVLNGEIYVTAEYLVKRYNQEFSALAENIASGQPNQHVRRENNLDGCVQMVLLEHLGYGPIEGLADRLNYGMDWAVEYFFGDWYRDDEAQRDYAKIPEPRQLLLARTPFWQALLLGGLTGRWADVERIAGWYNTHVDLESLGPLLESYIDPNADIASRAAKSGIVRALQTQLAVASGLALKPIPGIEELVSRVKRDELSKVADQGLLCALWETVLAKDQAAFQKAFSDKTRHFYKSRRPLGSHPITWVDLYTSAICLVAERNGLALPPLTPFKDAVLVRRQSIGLG